ncbi:MAG: amino acid permease [Acidobacteriota bacterium]
MGISENKIRTMEKNTNPENSLKRSLNLFDSSMIMVGIVLGSGIFLTTGIMAKALPSSTLILLAWIAGGLITLAGAMTYAELGALFPEAGGQYVYLREAFGPVISFLFGWMMLLIYLTGSVAGMAVAFAEYTGYFFPGLSLNKIILLTELNLFNMNFHVSISAGQIVAIGLIIFLSIISALGTGLGKIVQNIFTTLKIILVSGIIILGFLLGKGSPVDLSVNPSMLSIGQLISGFSLALIAVFWAFDGWNNINFVGGEIKNPTRNLPLTLIWGTVFITVVYVLINYLYLYALPLNEISGVVRIAEKAAASLFGGTTSAIITAAILISIFGSLNGSILTGPRVYFAMANDGLFFKRVARIHPKYKTPTFSIFIQALLACLLTLTGTFEQLLTFVMFIAIVFWIAAAFAVFTLRKKFPDISRPYKVWGYPYVPVFFILALLVVLGNTIIEKPVESLAGLAITISGLPVYFLWKKRPSSNNR